MGELTLDPGDVTAALRKNLESWKPSVGAETVGYVTSAGDGVARVSGLPGAAASELLEFPGGLTGVALNLDEDSIGAVIMGDSAAIEEGDEVRSTGRVLEVPVGDGLLGRVVDALGNPLDGKGPIESTETRLLETQAPSVVQRQPVNEPLQTGIKAIDAMTPIGRGQRQLIIGDRQTGKTAIVVDTIINRQGREVHLRRHWPEVVDRRRGAGHPRAGRRHGVHGDRQRPSVIGCRPPDVRTLCGVGHGAVLDVQR